jgi:hypothetical protein
MSSGLNLTSAVHVFPCLSCRETINTSVRQCPFCASPVDPAAAEAAAATMSRINQACSDASYLRIMAGVAGTFLVLLFIPFLTLIGLVGFTFLEFAIPVMSTRWWVKFGKIKTVDVGFRKAKTTAILVTAGAALFWVLRITGVVRVGFWIN